MKSFTVMLDIVTFVKGVLTLGTVKSSTVMLDIVTFVKGVSVPWDNEEFHCHAGHCDVG